MRWARSNISVLSNARFYGLWFDDWNTPDNHYRYECAIQLDSSNDLTIPKPFFRRRLEQGTVANCFASGRLTDIDAAWKRFALDWFPYSGCQPRSNFFLDEYPLSILNSGLRAVTLAALGGLSVRLCIPISEAASLHRSFEH